MLDTEEVAAGTAVLDVEEPAEALLLVEAGDVDEDEVVSAVDKLDVVLADEEATVALGLG